MKRQGYKRHMWLIDGVLYRIAQAKHYFVKHRGYAFTEKISTWDWSKLVIRTKTTTYEIDRKDFDRHAYTVDTSYGRQVVIQVQYLAQLSEPDQGQN